MYMSFGYEKKQQTDVPNTFSFGQNLLYSNLTSTSPNTEEPLAFTGINVSKK